MNLEEYLKTDDIKIDKLAELFFKEKYFYTFVYERPIPFKNEFFIQEIENDNCLCIFTNKELAEKYLNSTPTMKFWKLKKYKTEDFEIIFSNISKKINSVCINYGFHWAKLYFKEI